VDGTIAETTGECKQGMDISYKGIWGYRAAAGVAGHTKEPLYLVNRPGNQTSSSGAAVWIDRALELVSDFEELWLRGDTDFSLTEHLDKWDQKKGEVCLGLQCLSEPGRRGPANRESGLAVARNGPPGYEVQTKPRQRPDNVKEAIIREREYKNICLRGARWLSSATSRASAEGLPEGWCARTLSVERRAGAV